MRAHKDSNFKMDFQPRTLNFHRVSTSLNKITNININKQTKLKGKHTFLSRVATLWWYSSRKDSISASLDFLCSITSSN
jgi:hypothetical protein